jgi:hypothetical protein
MKNTPKILNLGPWKKITATCLPKDGYVVPVVVQCGCGCQVQDVIFASHDRQRGWWIDGAERYIEADDWQPTHFAKQAFFKTPKPLILKRK